MANKQDRGSTSTSTNFFRNWICRAENSHEFSARLTQLSLFTCSHRNV